jgi:GNAT superfamily N-acetyltransferase
VLKDHRGRGLGVELVRAAVDEGPFPTLRWMLHTQDAHGLYEKFGFGPPDERYLERPPAEARREAGEGREG